MSDTNKVYFSVQGGIGIRSLGNLDLPIWHAWFNSPIVTDQLNKGMFPNTPSKQEEFFRKVYSSSTDVLFGIDDVENDVLVGVVGIHQIDWVHRKGDISIVIGNPEYWGKGVASVAISLTVRHAFEKLNLRRLAAGMWGNNAGSRRCFEKNGFRLEGTFRKSFFYKNEYVDELRYGLLRDEWNKDTSEKEN